MRRMIGVALLLAANSTMFSTHSGTSALNSLGGRWSPPSRAIAAGPKVPGMGGTLDLPSGLAQDPFGNIFIARIDLLLQTCPGNDPAIAEIRSDFQIRRNGVLVADIPCSEPVSQMTAAQYTDELITLQGLRVIYYMDRGRAGHLPWTAGTLYDWMKTRIGGLNIRDGSGSFCCESFDGKTHAAIGAQDEFNREFDRQWEGISGNIGLYAHEARHVDGPSHSSCCGIPNGCDQTFDLTNMPSYGTQWWLNKAWLMGEINVGFGCLSGTRLMEIRDWHISSTDGFRDRLCDNKPAAVVPPLLPGGVCLYREPCGTIAVVPGTLSNATVGNAYNLSFTTIGTTLSVSFTLSSGALPTGLSLSQSGFLSGTPLVAGTSNFTVRATDANDCSGETAYSLLVAPILDYEADVSPRPTGSGSIFVSDWVQIGRFSVGLDTPSVGSEFQKADCAPRATQGDGTISVADWVQAGRYSVGLDPVSAAGGPTSPSASAQSVPSFVLAMSNSAQGRAVRAFGVAFRRGRVGELQIQFDAVGNENGLAFTLRYDANHLTFLNALIPASRSLQPTLLLNDRGLSKGRLGVALTLPVGKTFAPGSHRVITLRFTPTAGDERIVTQVRFDDSPVAREIVSAEGVSLPNASYMASAIAIMGASQTRGVR